MESRDLFLGLLLLAGAGWIATATDPVAGSPAFLVAMVGCGLAGVVYLVSDVAVGRSVAGRPLTRLRVRAVSQALLGISLVAIGGDGLLAGGLFAGGNTFSAVIAGLGGLVVAFALVLWTRGGPSAPPTDA